MIVVHLNDGKQAEITDRNQLEALNGLIWLDMIFPTESEEALVEMELGLDVPTRIERNALEESARFYVEADSLVLMVPVSSRAHENGPYGRHPIGFVLKGEVLVSVRECIPRAFAVGQSRSSARIAAACTGQEVMAALLEAIVERGSDQLQEVHDGVERLMEQVLGQNQNQNMGKYLRALGQFGASTARNRDSFSGLLRAIRFAVSQVGPFGLDEARLRDILDDAHAMQHQSEALSTDLTFLLDSVLGLVGARQNEAMKVLAIITVLFAPPTLISSIYGMNFTHLPWLGADNGPMWAAVAMVLSSLGLFMFAKLTKRF